METSFVEEQNVSISNCSPVELRSIEQVAADDKHEANECEHFTIRGYVAEVRKKDAKICWPFLTLHNHTPGEDAELLPPLSVTKFRRWNCQNCQDKAVSSEPVIENGAVMDIQNNEVKNSNCLLLQDATVASYPNATKYFSGFSQLSEENALEGKLNDTNSCVGVCICEHHPSLCCFKETDESAIAADLIKEGLQINRNEQGISEENHKPPNYSAFTATDGEKYAIEDRGERNDVIGVNTSDTSHGDYDPDMVSAKEIKMKSICGIVDAEKSRVLTSKGTDVAAIGHEDDLGVRRICKMKEPSDILSGEHGMPVGGDHDLPKDDFLTSIAAQISDHYSIGMERDSQEVSDIVINSIDKMPRNQSNPGKLYGKLQHKRVRKVRLLNDIMRNEDFCVSRKVHIVKGDAEHNESDSKKTADASNGEPQNFEQESRFVNRKTRVNPIKRKSRYDTLQNDDEKHSLLYWLKKKPKKVVTKKEDVQTNSVDCSIRSSEVAEDISAGKDLGRRHSRETIWGGKNMLPQVKARRPCLLLQQNSNTEKEYAPENSTNGNLQQKPVRSSTKVIINKKILNRDLKIQNINHQKDIQSKKKKKVHEIDDGRLYQMYLPKGKVIKKQRTMRTCDKGAADDIPMDIVELLAKNLHERRMMDAEHSKQSMGQVAQMSDNMKNGCIMDVAKCHGNKLPDALYKDLTPKMLQLDYNINDVLVTGKCYTNAYCRPKAYPSCSIGNQDSWTNPSKQVIICSSDRLHGHSQSNKFPMSGTGLPVIGRYGNSSLQNFCGDRTKIQPVGSHYTDQVISDQSSVRKMHNASPILLNQATSSINVQNIGSNFNHMYMDSNNKFRERDTKTVVHKTDWWRLSDPPYKQLPDSQWTDKSSINLGIHTADTSFMEARSGCHSKVTEPEEYTSGNMPASNLLWLMNQAVPQGGFYHASSNMNHAGLIPESELYSTDRSTELLGSGVGVRSAETIKHPPAVGNPGQGLPPGRFYHISSNMNRTRLIQESELYSTDCFTELLGSGVGVRSRETVKHPPAVGNPGQDVLQGFYCKPVRPLPRIGILGSFLQNEIASHSDNFRTHSCFKEGYSTPMASLDIIGKEKLMASCSTTHSRISGAQTSISIDENSRCVVPTVASISHPECSETRDGMGQIGFRNEDGYVRPPRGSYSMEVCIINRNPADFTISDEDNVYMRGGEDPKPGYLLASGIQKHSVYVEKLKQPKLKKLNAMEWLMRRG